MRECKYFPIRLHTFLEIFTNIDREIEQQEQYHQVLGLLRDNLSFHDIGRQ